MTTIQRKELGRTGVMIPEIGAGTWKYRGGPELLRKAVELGMAVLDTAEYYRNEEVVGQAIRGLREEVFVATKLNHWKPREVISSAEASLRKLGIDCIDLYQLHWPNAAVPIAETMGAMEDLVEQGKVRFIGVSNFSVAQLKRAQSALRRHPIVSNQVRYSLVERTIERDVAPFCLKHGITVIAYSPLAGDFQLVLDADPGDVLGQVARETNRTRAQVALNWCISRSGVVTIPRTASENHLVENSQSSGWTLSAEQRARLSSGIRFRSRGRLEVTARGLVKGWLQRFGLSP